MFLSFPRGSDGEEFTCNAGDPGSIPRLGRSAGEGIGYPLQYSWASLVAQLVKNPPAMLGDLGSIPGLGKIPWRKEWQPTPVFLPGEFCGQRSLVGYSPWRWTGWISLLSKGLSRVFSNTTLQKHRSLAFTFLYSPTLTSTHVYWKNHSFD